MVNESTRRQWCFFKTLNSCRSLGYARSHESIRIFTDLCKPIEIYIYARKRHPFASHPAAKHPNAANLQLQTCDKNQWTFLLCSTGVNSSSRNNFGTLGSFAKVSAPVRTIIPSFISQPVSNCHLIISNCLWALFIIARTSWLFFIFILLSAS